MNLAEEESENAFTSSSTCEHFTQFKHLFYTSSFWPSPPAPPRVGTAVTLHGSRRMAKNQRHNP
jgi:hypothetical protein